MEQIVIYLSLVPRLLNLKQKIQKFSHIHYAQGKYQKTGHGIIRKKNGFNGYAYDFSTDYNAILVSDMLDIHKYLMKKNKIV